MTCVPTPGSNPPVAEGSSVCGRHSKCLRSCRRKTPKTLEYIPLIKWILISRLMFKEESPGKRHTLRSSTPRHTCSKTLVKELDKKGAERALDEGWISFPCLQVLTRIWPIPTESKDSLAVAPLQDTQCHQPLVIIIAIMLSEMEVASQTKQ